MRTWKVYERNGAKPKAIKVGFNWWAFFFFYVWSLLQRLWLVSILGYLALIVGALILIVFVESFYKGTEIYTTAQLMPYIFEGAFQLVFGFKGNEWAGDKLESIGYFSCVTIEAKNADEAIERFLASKHA